MLKSAFSDLFFRKQKGTTVFQWQEDINVVLIISFIYKAVSQFFEILIFSQDI